MILLARGFASGSCRLANCSKNEARQDVRERFSSRVTSALQRQSWHQHKETTRQGRASKHNSHIEHVSLSAALVSTQCLAQIDAASRSI